MHGPPEAVCLLFMGTHMQVCTTGQHHMMQHACHIHDETLGWIGLGLGTAWHGSRNES